VPPKPGLRTTLALLFLLALSLGLLIYPLTVIQPFRHQGEKELAAALWVMRWRPYFEAFAVTATLAIVIWYWRQKPRILPRILTSLTAIIICAAAALTRVNIFELMFHRYDKPAFAQAPASQLDADEKVIAIALNGQARAYPIRSMSYHHIVNDEVGGIPVVATY